MKRTRRIEIVRYTRRVTVSGGNPRAADPPAEQQAGELILEALAVIPPTSGQVICEASAPDDGADGQPLRRHLLARLGALLRLRR